MKKSAKITAIVGMSLVIIYVLITILLPPKLDQKFNSIALAPPYTVSERAQRLYNSLDFVADLHCDALLWKRDLLVRNDFGAVDIPRMLDANIGIQGFTIVTKSPKDMNFDKNTGDTDQITLPYILQGRPISSWFDLCERAIAQCEALREFESESESSFSIIKSVADLNTYLIAKKQNKNITAGFLGIEGMHAINGNLDNIDKLFDAGVRMMSPTHFFDNKLGSSAHGVLHEGLTDFGRKAIRKLREKRIILDISHSSTKLIDEIFEMESGPVVSSHTGAQGDCETVRNLSDAHLMKIAESKGLIGIAMFEPATCGATPAATARSIKYCIDLVGADYVALGSDFDGAIRTHTDITGMPLYVEEMLKLAISEEDIRKVMGGNVKRFLLDNLPY
ncbi:MAG: membrane dipeptidase [Cyclobacteriaceae bacterium]